MICQYMFTKKVLWLFIIQILNILLDDNFIPVWYFSFIIVKCFIIWLR